jgi:hypothetical protein
VKKDPKLDADRLISGKMRSKAGRAGADNTVVRVDGTDYAWSYRHGWVVWGKGIKAISISVSLRPGRTRELILDFSLKVGVEEGKPSEPRVLKALEEGVRAALAAGWDPESRGRAFRYEVADSV